VISLFHLSPRLAQTSRCGITALPELDACLCRGPNAEARGRRPQAPEGGEIRLHPLLEQHEFQVDNTRHLTSENWIPGSVTLVAFVTGACVFGYDFAKGVFASMLDVPILPSCCQS